MIYFISKKIHGYPASCPIQEEGSFLGDIAYGESYKGLLILDPHEDFKTVYRENIQSVGGRHLAARNSNKL